MPPHPSHTITVNGRQLSGWLHSAPSLASLPLTPEDWKPISVKGYWNARVHKWDEIFARVDAWYHWVAVRLGDPSREVDPDTVVVHPSYLTDWVRWVTSPWGSLDEAAKLSRFSDAFRAYHPATSESVPPGHVFLLA